MDSPAETPTLAPGTVLADRYRIEALLGEGGMGAVYRASHVHMHKAFAVKVLHPSLTSSPEILARFEREAVAAANIEHPNVAHATDFGRLSDGSFYLVLEHVAGASLRDALGAGAFEPKRALTIVKQIASAIGAAHAKGIVHRDLKPENVMLVERNGAPDFVKVLDFGIAKVEPPPALGDEAPAKPLTRMGVVMGTPDYMPPEQALGQPVDHRADLYALGVMLFELLAGVRPFEGNAVSVMRDHVTAPVPPLPEPVSGTIDPRVTSLMRELLAKTPEGRPASAGEVVTRIEEISASASPLSPPVSAARLPTAASSTAAVVSTEDGPVNARAATMLASEAPAQRASPLGGRGRAIAIGGTIGGVLLLGGILALVLQSPGKPPERTARSESSDTTSKDSAVLEHRAEPSHKGAQGAAQGAGGAASQKKCNTRLPVLGCID